MEETNPFDAILATAEPGQIVAIYNIEDNEPTYEVEDAEGNVTVLRKPPQRILDGAPTRDLTAKEVAGYKPWIQRGLIASGLYRLA